MNATDATGTRLELDGPPRRIVSLVPSLTETLFALGAGERVAAVTQFCEEPAAGVRGLPKVGGTKTPDVPAIIAVQPDLVVASAEENREQDVLALRRAGLRVYVTHYPTVRAAVDGIGELARLIGTAPASMEWLTRTDALVRALAGSPMAAPVRYFCPIWRRPYMVARCDTYLSDLLTLAGGESVFSADGPARYYPVELQALAALAPQVILLPDEPYRFAPRHLADFESLPGIPALMNRQVHFIDGKALTWYGPRTTAALAHFAELFRQARSATGKAAYVV